MQLPEANRLLLAGHDLSREDMQAVMRQIMSGEAGAGQLGAFLGLLAMKGESVPELVGAAELMRELAVPVSASGPLTDCVGTGGDHQGLFNISTAAAITAAAGGATLAKHGNRAATGKSGSADLLEAAGLPLDLTAEQLGECLNACGIAFLFAPVHHTAMRHAIGVRREIGIRSIFNLLGPLTNPAGPTRQLVGVFEPRWMRPMAEAFATLGSEHTLVVCSEDGLDELSLAAPTRVIEWRGGEFTEYEVKPADFGLTPAPLDPLRAESPEDSLTLMRNALSGTPGPARDIVALNAGATLYAADVADSFKAGVAAARAILADGQAETKFDEWLRTARELAEA